MHVPWFLYVTAVLHFSAFSKFSLIPLNLCLQPARLCACPGPGDWFVCPPLGHSRGCVLHEGPSRRTPETALRSARKGVAGLWYKARDRIHISFNKLKYASDNLLSARQSAHLLFCRALKFFLKAGLTWLSSSTREWHRSLGAAGFGLKLKAVDLEQSE